MLAGSHAAAVGPSLGVPETALVDDAYELAIFQICDDGGLYTELTAVEVQRLLLAAIAAEVVRTGSDDPEALKAAALSAVQAAPGLAFEVTAAARVHSQLEEGRCPS